MKKLTFLIWSFIVLTTTSVFAQDAIHGVDGYYNWTPKQMQADNLITIKTSGYKGSAVTNVAFLEFLDDHVKVNMGLNALPNNFRTDWSVSNKYSGANTLKITKKYPVIAVKIGYCPTPQNMKAGAIKSWSLAWKFHGGVDSTVYTVATTTPDGVVHPKNAFQTTNGGVTFYGSSYYINTPNGKGGWDSNHRIQIDTWLQNATDGTYYHNWNARNAIGDSVNTAQSSSSTNMGYFMVDDAVADQIVYVNLASVFKRDSALHYDKDIEVFQLGMIMNNFFCDTTLVQVVRNEAGDSIGVNTITKPRELLPYYNIKWIKTFESPTALKNAILINAGDGNDTRSDAQLSLNAALYAAKMTLENYKHAEPTYLDAYQAAYDAALEVYKSTAPSEDRTSAEWIAWDAVVTQAITDLSTARATFKYAITNNITEPYNIIKTADSSSDLMIGANTTVNGVSCKSLTFGGSGSGSPFVFSKSSTLVGGLTAYTLINSTGKVCLIKDTLVYVENSKNISTSLAPVAYFVFSNRSINEEPFYDMYVNGKYVIISPLTGKMTTATEIPTGDISEITNYLFNIEKATYDESNDDPNVTLFQGWEFNDDLGGWEINRWRMFGTLTSRTRGTSTYAVLGTKPEYYNAKDTLETTLLTTTFSSDLSTGPSYRRESGVYPNASKLNVTTYDSLLMYWTNSYKRRYFAVKTASNNGIAKMAQVSMTAGSSDIGVVFSTDNILGKKGDVLYWDMLALGVPYGNKAMLANYMGCNGFTSTTDEVYIDWMRTYEKIEDIPYELVDINADVKRSYESSVVQVLVNNKTINVKTEKTSNITIMNLNGQVLASAKGNEAVFNVENAGVYIISALENNQLVTRKVMVK